MWHIVMLKPRADISASERAEFTAAFERAIREIPAVRQVRIGTRVTHGAGYESAMPDSADVLAAIEFDDLAGLQAYLRHPAHDDLGELFGRLLSSALVYDFEVGGMEVLAKLQ
jgi:Stress responsive A/B Barrel Domain